MCLKRLACIWESLSCFVDYHSEPVIVLICLICICVLVTNYILAGLFVEGAHFQLVVFSHVMFDCSKLVLKIYETVTQISNTSTSCIYPREKLLQLYIFRARFEFLKIFLDHVGSFTTNPV